MKGGVLLMAAGTSQRFGGDKRRARQQGFQPLLLSSLGRAQASGQEVYVVLGRQDYALRLQVRAQGGCALALPHSEGLGHSIAQGVARLAIPQGWDYCAIHLADMPAINPGLWLNLVKLARPNRIVRPEYCGQVGHPVIFGRQFFHQLSRLRGDKGAGSLVDRYPGRQRLVACADKGVVVDIDRPADLRALQAR